MQFGMILLVLVIACSFAGSLIVQNREPMEYVNRYGAQAAQIILALGADDVFSAPWFLVLLIALCLNLTLCSIVRLPSIRKAGKGLLSRAMEADAQETLEEKQAEKLSQFLSSRHYQMKEGEGRKVYFRHLAGYYGSFVTHLSFLLILLVGAAALMTAEVVDQTVMPGGNPDP